MTNAELQTAIDSLLLHLRSGSSYVSLVQKQLELLFEEQKKRSMVDKVTFLP